MYAFYNQLLRNGEHFLEFVEEISLAGCNVGIIAKNLRMKLQATDNAPLQWQLNIEEIYDEHREMVIIDFKPNRTDQVLMGELTHVFGDSDEGTEPWTPVLFRCKMVADLNSIREVERFDKEFFKPHENPDIVYTMGHLYGSVSNGNLTGTWSPGRGSMNSLLLWSTTLNYFITCIQRTDPNLIDAIGK